MLRPQPGMAWGDLLTVIGRRNMIISDAGGVCQEANMNRSAAPGTDASKSAEAPHSFSTSSSKSETKLTSGRKQNTCSMEAPRQQVCHGATSVVGASLSGSGSEAVGWTESNRRICVLLTRYTAPMNGNLSDRHSYDKLGPNPTNKTDLAIISGGKRYEAAAFTKIPPSLEYLNRRKGFKAGRHPDTNLIV